MVKLVGILNVTPDSFSDGGQFFDSESAFAQANKLFRDGADIVDVGAESTRPGATPLTPDEEWSRLEKIIQRLVKEYPEKISIDTYHPSTAARALKLGDVIINDVTGLSDPKMVELITTVKARCVVGHLPGGTPQTAHDGPLVDDMRQVVSDLLNKAAELEKRGLPGSNIILDPGIGFGKTLELNRQLLEFAREVPGYAVMVGYSRKRFLGDNRMEPEPNLEAGRTAIGAGAAYLRVHDVAGHRQLLR
ncbi:MAG TPA: dihydropteroate synthase [Candidatus Saccharimonadales bacterium]|nr:dihydropteroate synthase [Candidatus Saccharimonadales bacterium]